MTDQIKQSILRIRNSKSRESKVVGAGFIINLEDRIAVTCAHVVNHAINDLSNKKKPRKQIYVDFPFSDSNQIFRAKVIQFSPKTENNSGDIAIFEILDELPTDVNMPKLSKSHSHRDNGFMVFGFPPQLRGEDGRWAEGKLQDRLPNGQIQAIGVSDFGDFVDHGFSGSPVLDKKLDQVMGMVAQIDVKRNKRTAFIIPLDKIQETYPNSSLKIIGEQVADEYDFIFTNDKQLEIALSNLDLSEQLSVIYSQIEHTIHLALRIFIVIAIRVYEYEIVNETQAYIKKTRPIIDILNHSFRHPSYETIRNLAEKCFYLVDSQAPNELIAMKDCLDKTIILQELGVFWNDLEDIFDLDRTQHSRILNKSTLKRDLLKQLLKELDPFFDKSFQNILMRSKFEPTPVAVMNWLKALEYLKELFKPVLQIKIECSEILDRDPETQTFNVVTTTYFENQRVVTNRSLDWLRTDAREESAEIVLEDGRIHIFPFFQITVNSLSYYQRTTYSGYVFFSLLNNKKRTIKSKKRFSQTLFNIESIKLGSNQELFWTDVIPRTNDKGIRANIPEEGFYEFIGRLEQLQQVNEEVISIPNENGIIYGPGGIGKTALIIQLTKNLYNEKYSEDILFDNIVWVSAKRTYYNYVTDTIKKRDPQIQSLDSILLTILRFFEFEGFEDYSFSDRKELVIDIFMNQRVLLIVDNFETIRETEADNILDFFGTEVKKRLRSRPSNFKIIITSRQVIPTGFRQINLQGMSDEDATELIDSLYKQRYNKTHEPLTIDQKETIIRETNGIPIIIKHCIAKYYEYNQTFSAVLKDLPSQSENVVEFSFKEILDQIAAEKERISLKILFLLDIVGTPLMVRQIADILEIGEREIESRIPLLASFECIKRRNEDREKYALNTDIYMLVKQLISKNPDIHKKVYSKHFHNYTFDKQMDYSTHEKDIIDVFESQLAANHYHAAQIFIENEVQKNPDSILLTYHYANYLLKNQNNPDKASVILTNIQSKSRNHPSILRLLFKCYIASKSPKFESAENIIKQLQTQMEGFVDDNSFYLEVARFYVRWSTAIKQGVGLDPFEENTRQSTYKSYAHDAQEYLSIVENTYNGLNAQEKKEITFHIHEVYYLQSQCYYNLWEYDQALQKIQQTINLASAYTVPTVAECENYRRLIYKTQEKYSRNSRY